MGATCTQHLPKSENCCGAGSLQHKMEVMNSKGLPERTAIQKNRRWTQQSNDTHNADKTIINGETDYIFDDEKVSQQFNSLLKEKRKINVIDKELFKKFDTKSRFTIFGYIRDIERLLNTTPKQQKSLVSPSEETNDSESTIDDDEVLIPPHDINNDGSENMISPENHLLAPDSNMSINKLRSDSMSQSLSKDSEGFDPDLLISEININLMDAQLNMDRFEREKIRIPNNIHYLILLYYYLMENEFENEALELWNDRANISEFMNTTLESTRNRMWDKFDKHKKGMLSTEKYLPKFVYTISVLHLKSKQRKSIPPKYSKVKNCAKYMSLLMIQSLPIDQKKYIDKQHFVDNIHIYLASIC